MEIAYPTAPRDGRLVIPFSFGAVAYADGFPADANRYDAGTPQHARWAAGWLAAASCADAEMADYAAEVLADASGAARA